MSIQSLPSGSERKSSKARQSPQSTSWGGVASWYEESVENRESYQMKVILPHLLRLMALQPREQVLDLACGSGFFAHRFAETGASVTGIDIAPELIALAKRKAIHGEEFLVAPSDRLPSTDQRFAKVAIVLALQNIRNLEATLFECQRVLQPMGSLYLVLNHPAFRIPKESRWGFDVGSSTQYRRLDSYLSESHTEIAMAPSKGKLSETTISFHRPLQVYVKALRKCGFAVTGLEEWISHKKSALGPHAKAEDTARKEFPLFLYLEAIKLP